MISGIGVDIVEIKRIKDVLTRHKQFPQRILTIEEQEEFHTLQTPRQIEWLAGRFAAKEAFAKAYGTGIGTYLSFQEILISTNKLGKPTISHPDFSNIHLTISHTKEYAVAYVVIEVERI